jgi:PhnB protein
MAAAFHVKPIGGIACYTTYYAENVNKVFNQDLHAGATNVMPVMDMFWGERY